MTTPVRAFAVSPTATSSPFSSIPFNATLCSNSSGAGTHNSSCGGALVGGGIPPGTPPEDGFPVKQLVGGLVAAVGLCILGAICYARRRRRRAVAKLPDAATDAVAVGNDYAAAHSGDENECVAVVGEEAEPAVVAGPAEWVPSPMVAYAGASPAPLHLHRVSSAIPVAVNAEIAPPAAGAPTFLSMWDEPDAPSEAVAGFVSGPALHVACRAPRPSPLQAVPADSSDAVAVVVAASPGAKAGPAPGHNGRSLAPPSPGEFSRSYSASSNGGGGVSSSNSFTAAPAAYNAASAPLCDPESIDSLNDILNGGRSAETLSVTPGPSRAGHHAATPLPDAQTAGATTLAIASLRDVADEGDDGFAIAALLRSIPFGQRALPLHSSSSPEPSSAVRPLAPTGAADDFEDAYETAVGTASIVSGSPSFAAKLVLPLRVAAVNSQAAAILQPRQLSPSHRAAPPLQPPAVVQTVVSQSDPPPSPRSVQRFIRRRARRNWVRVSRAAERVWLPTGPTRIPPLLAPPVAAATVETVVAAPIGRGRANTHAPGHVSRRVRRADAARSVVLRSQSIAAGGLLRATQQRSDLPASPAVIHEERFEEELEFVGNAPPIGSHAGLALVSVVRRLESPDGDARYVKRFDRRRPAASSVGSFGESEASHTSPRESSQAHRWRETRAEGWLAPAPPLLVHAASAPEGLRAADASNFSMQSIGHRPDLAHASSLRSWHPSESVEVAGAGARASHHVVGLARRVKRLHLSPVLSSPLAPVRAEPPHPYSIVGGPPSPLREAAFPFAADGTITSQHVGLPALRISHAPAASQRAWHVTDALSGPPASQTTAWWQASVGGPAPMPSPKRVQRMAPQHRLAGRQDDPARVSGAPPVAELASDRHATEGSSADAELLAADGTDVSVRRSSLVRAPSFLRRQQHGLRRHQGGGAISLQPLQRLGSGRKLAAAPPPLSPVAGLAGAFAVTTISSPRLAVSPRSEASGAGLPSHGTSTQQPAPPSLEVPERFLRYRGVDAAPIRAPTFPPVSDSGAAGDLFADGAPSDLYATQAAAVTASIGQGRQGPKPVRSTSTASAAPDPDIDNVLELLALYG